MNTFGGFLVAILLTLLGIWIFQVVWNNGVVRAVTVTRPIDFLTALLLVIVFFPGILALGAGLFLLPSSIMHSVSEGGEANVRIQKNPSPPTSTTPANQKATRNSMYPMESYY